MTDAVPVDLWKNAVALIKPELMPFVTFSPANLSELTALAQCAEDPVAWLGEEFNKRGQRKKDLKEAWKIRRKQEDAKRYRRRPPGPPSSCRSKASPGGREKKDTMRFGFVMLDDTLTVYDRDGSNITYSSIDELVETWSVD